MSFQPLNRRSFVASGLAFTALASNVIGAAASSAPRLARVILDNDFAGDPDGLFQLAHHVLCRSLSIPLIIGSHLPGPFSSGHDAADSAARARTVLELMKLDGHFRVLSGSESPIASRSTWQPSAASAAIVAEAMREDAEGPLVYAAGAGLTELALAWLSEPRIGRRMRLIWIGGNPHAGFGNPGDHFTEPEFNFSIDPLAAQIVFNETDIEIWQVPSDTYRQMLFGNGELAGLGASSPLGAWLKAQVDAVPARLASIPGVPPQTATDAYVLGDSPLVTLTALVPPYLPDATSCRYRLMPTPRLLEDGRYVPRPRARAMRVYSAIDASLTFRDMLARFTLLEK